MCPGLLLLILAGSIAMLSLIVWALVTLVNDMARTAARPAVRHPAPDLGHHDQLAKPREGVTPPAKPQSDPRLSPKERGEELLLRLLSPSQRYEYQRHGTITVPITLPGSIYAFARIGKGTRGVIWSMVMTSGHATGKGAPVVEQCVYVDPTPDKLVKEDDLISKLLWLRADPDALARVSGIQLASRLMWFSSPPPQAF